MEDGQTLFFSVYGDNYSSIPVHSNWFIFEMIILFWKCWYSCWLLSVCSIAKSYYSNEYVKFHCVNTIFVRGLAIFGQSFRRSLEDYSNKWMCFCICVFVHIMQYTHTNIEVKWLEDCISKINTIWSLKAIVEKTLVSVCGFVGIIHVSVRREMSKSLF